MLNSAIFSGQSMSYTKNQLVEDLLFAKTIRNACLWALRRGKLGQSEVYRTPIISFENNFYRTAMLTYTKPHEQN